MKNLLLLLIPTILISCKGDGELKKAFEQTGFEGEITVLQKSSTFLNEYADPYNAFYPESTTMQSAIDDNFRKGKKNLDKMILAVSGIAKESTETTEYVDRVFSLTDDYDDWFGEEKLNFWKGFGKVWDKDMLYEKTEFSVDPIFSLRMELVDFHGTMMAKYIHIVEENEHPKDKAKFRADCIRYVTKRIHSVLGSGEGSRDVIETMNNKLYDYYNLDPNAEPQYRGD